MAYGIQLVHQSPHHAQHDKTAPLWLRRPAPVPGDEVEQVLDWSLVHVGALRFATRAEAAAAQPAPWTVTTKVVALPSPPSPTILQTGGKEL